MDKGYIAYRKRQIAAGEPYIGFQQWEKGRRGQAQKVKKFSEDELIKKYYKQYNSYYNKTEKVGKDPMDIIDWDRAGQPKQ